MWAADLIDFEIEGWFTFLCLGLLNLLPNMTVYCMHILYAARGGGDVLHKNVSQTSSGNMHRTSQKFSCSRFSRFTRNIETKAIQYYGEKNSVLLYLWKSNSMVKKVQKKIVSSKPLYDLKLIWYYSAK